tara:strand:+ start:403 stop:2130 length:1728 start_codon:yes stop_codon:yes gene_type:complete
MSVYEDWEEVTFRSQSHLNDGSGYVPWGTGLVEGAKDLAGRAVNQLQEWAEEDPDTWTDDALRLMGRGVQGAGRAMGDWERRSEEGEIGLRSAAGTALRFMNWSSEQGSRLGRTGARAVGVNEELGGFLGSFIPEAIGTKGLSKAAQIAKTTKQLRKLRKLGYGLEVDDITKGRHAFAYADEVLSDPSVLGDLGTAATSSKKARKRLGKIDDQIKDQQALEEFAKFEAFEPGGRKRGFTSGDRVTPDGRLAGQTKIDEFRTAVKSNASDAELTKILSTDYAASLDPHYLDGRRGYYNIERLVKDKELLNKVINKQDEIAQLHYKWMKSKTIGNQRNFFEAVGDTYFNEYKLLYTSRNKWEKKLVDVANWAKGDQWHHVFGNREAAEFLMSAVARDPLVGVNLARLLKKEGLTAAGVARNLMVMPEEGHKQFHRFFKLLGGEPAGRTRGVMDFADFGQAIADAAQRGHTYGPKVFDPKTGLSLAGKIIPPDPSYVNELFSMIKSYAKANRRFEQLIRKGEVWVDPKLKRIVPKGTKGAKRYDFKATVKDGGPNAPRKESYLLSEKIGTLLKILDEP